MLMPQLGAYAGVVMFISLRCHAAGLAALSALAGRVVSHWPSWGLVCGVLLIISATHSSSFAQTGGTVYVSAELLDDVFDDIKKGCRNAGDSFPKALKVNPVL